MSKNKVAGDYPAIEARGLIKVYGETRALDGIDLTTRDVMNNTSGAVTWSLIATAAITLVFAPLTLHLYSKQG